MCRTARDVARRAAAAAIAGDRWVAAAVIVAAVLIGYGRTLGFGMTGLDDRHLLAGIAGCANPLALFTRNAIDFQGGLFYYRPLLLASFWLTAAAGYHGVALHHLVNIVLHCGVCLFLLALLLQLGCGRARAFGLTLLFAVHPVLSQAVAWLPGRNDSLLALFLLPSAWCALRFVGTGRWRWFWLGQAAWAAALFTKESAAMLPLALLPLLITARADHQPQLRRVVALSAGWALALAGYWWARHAVAGSLGADASASFNNVPVAVCQAAMGIAKMFLPWQLTPIPRVETAQLWAVAGGLGLAAILLLLNAGANRPLFIAGLCWCLLFLLPAVAIANGFSAAYEHRLYLPLIGICIACCGAGAPRPAPPPWVTYAPLLVAVVVLALLVRTAAHAAVFRDEVTFWECAERDDPSSPEVHYNLGIVYGVRGDARAAADQFRQTSGLAPGAAPAWSAWATVTAAQGDPLRATWLMRRAAALDPGNARYRQAIDQWTKHGGVR